MVCYNANVNHHALCAIARRHREFRLPGAGTGPFQCPNAYSIGSTVGDGILPLDPNNRGSRLRARSAWKKSVLGLPQILTKSNSWADGCRYVSAIIFLTSPPRA